MSRVNVGVSEANSLASLPNLQRILDFLSLRNLASNELFFITLINLTNIELIFMKLIRGRMKRYLALDIGDVRIGVARSDLMGIIATPLETINRKKVKSVKRIAELCKENNTTSIVVGIPKSLDGEEKRQAEKVREYIEKLKKEIENLEIIEIDERFSTVIADNILKDLNKNGAIEKRKVVDKVAASIILQTYLDMKK
ncbi:YqgF family RNAse H domain-containing protein [Fusobacterium periodonticum 2_1_31]|nr:YqgF family RNAse H domain-containing protein [Fusobacterium periodonticum 2_1_31]